MAASKHATFLACRCVARNCLQHKNNVDGILASLSDWGLADRKERRQKFKAERFVGEFRFHGFTARINGLLVGALFGFVKRRKASVAANCVGFITDCDR